MQQFLKKKGVVPVAALLLTVSLGSAAFAATGSSSTDTSAAVTSTVATSTAPGSDSGTGSPAMPPGANASNPWGNQRSDETLLTGDALAKVKEVALTKAGSDATVVRIETEADGHGAYEAHVVKADGTPVTVYVDSSFNFLSVEDQPSGGHSGPPAAAPGTDSTTSGATGTTSA